VCQKANGPKAEEMDDDESRRARSRNAQPANGSSPSSGGVNDSPRSATVDRPSSPPSFASCTAAFSATAASDPVVDDIERAAIAAEG
jgi:hypothetical protein